MVCSATTITKKRSNFVLKQQIQYVPENLENTHAIEYMIEYMITKGVKIYPTGQTLDAIQNAKCKIYPTV